MNLAPTVELSACSHDYASGIPGIRQTLGIMRSMVREGRKDVAVRRAATSIVFLTPERDELSEVHALFSFVRDRVRYVRDILDVETLSTPDKTLAGMLGDCDDQSTLLAAMLESVGYPTRFVVAGYNTPGHLEHVYLQVFAGGDWIDADPTENGELGDAPPNPVDLFYEDV